LFQVERRHPVLRDAVILLAVGVVGHPGDAVGERLERVRLRAGERELAERAGHLVRLFAGRVVVRLERQFGQLRGRDRRRVLDREPLVVGNVLDDDHVLGVRAVQPGEARKLLAGHPVERLDERAEGGVLHLVGVERELGVLAAAERLDHLHLLRQPLDGGLAVAAEDHLLDGGVLVDRDLPRHRRVRNEDERDLLAGPADPHLRLAAVDFAVALGVALVDADDVQFAVLVFLRLLFGWRIGRLLVVGRSGVGKERQRDDERREQGTGTHGSTPVGENDRNGLSATREMITRTEVRALAAVCEGEECSTSSGVSERREQVIALQILVVGENVIVRHAGTEQLEQHLNRIAQPADTRLPVAHRRVNRDARKQWVHSNSRHVRLIPNTPSA
jgi:hypothetical protein